MRGYIGPCGYVDRHTQVLIYEEVLHLLGFVDMFRVMHKIPFGRGVGALWHIIKISHSHPVTLRYT